MTIKCKEIKFLSATQLAEMVRNKEISARELVEATYANIQKTDPVIDAFNCVCEEYATEIAKKVDEKVKNNDSLPPLAGVPIAIKDNINIKNVPTTCSSKILEGFKPPYSATVINRIEENLMIPVGKVNLDEFAMGSSTENSATKITKNPWNTSCVPGGSSGGSAACVAAGQVSLSLGSDTGGSIRLPASFCGVIGMKPTYGMVSRFGLVAFASSLDQIGPFGRTMEDVAALLQAISGHDRRDSTSLNVEVPDYTKELKNGVKGLKIGLIKELMSDGIQPEIKEAVEKAAALYKELGADIVEVEIPRQKYGIAAYYLIATAEASSNLARYDGVKYGYRNRDAKDIMEMYLTSREEGFGEEVKRRIMLGTYALSSGYYDAYYKKALQVRALIKQDFDNAFNACDLMLSPVAPSTAFEIGSKTDDPLAMYLCDIATVTANLAGIPGISIPVGIDQQKLPIGIQLQGPTFSESTLLRAGYALEQEVQFAKNYSLVEEIK